MDTLFKVFSEENLQKIHEKTLWLLEKTGVKIYHEECLKYLADNGAIVDFEKKQARFRGDFVENHISGVPRTVNLASRDSQHDIILPHPSEGFYTACATGPNICVDVKSGGHRNVEIADLAEWVKISHFLENIDMLAACSPEDKPPETRDVYAVKTMLENTTKHCLLQPFSEHTLKYHFKMALAIAGGEEQLRERPFFTMGCAAVSPLSFKPMDIEILYLSTHYGIPIQFAALPSAGATAPVTIAGAVLQCNVEILAGIIMAQIFRPGTPIVYCPLQYAMHMARGMNLQASPEALLAAIGSTQLASQFYHFPTRVYGVNTDSHIPDSQSMLERGLETPLILFAGADIIAGIGGLACITTMSNLQLVIDDELIGTLRKLVQKVDFNDDIVAADVIAEVGSGGQYLDSQHTLKYFKDVYRPNIFSQLPLDQWKIRGAKSLDEVAKERLDKILDMDQEPILSDSTIMNLNEIVKEADSVLVKNA